MYRRFKCPEQGDMVTRAVRISVRLNILLQPFQIPVALAVFFALAQFMDVPTIESIRSFPL